MFFVKRKKIFMYESPSHFLWRPFLKRFFEIGQCQSMVIKNDNTNNGCYENNQFRPVVPNMWTKILLTHPKIPHPSLPFEKKYKTRND
jgi:hypothetical protein